MFNERLLSDIQPFAVYNSFTARTQRAERHACYLRRDSAPRLHAPYLNVVPVTAAMPLDVHVGESQRNDVSRRGSDCPYALGVVRIRIRKIRRDENSIVAGVCSTASWTRQQQKIADPSKLNDKVQIFSA